MTQLLSRNI